MHSRRVFLFILLYLLFVSYALLRYFRVLQVKDNRRENLKRRQKDAPLRQTKAENLQEEFKFLLRSRSSDHLLLRNKDLPIVRQRTIKRVLRTIASVDLGERTAKYKGTKLETILRQVDEIRRMCEFGFKVQLVLIHTWDVGSHAKTMDDIANYLEILRRNLWCDRIQSTVPFRVWDWETETPWEQFRPGRNDMPENVSDWRRLDGEKEVKSSILPLLHRILFARNLDNFDFFIHSEDDMIVRLENVMSFCCESHRTWVHFQDDKSQKAFKVPALSNLSFVPLFYRYETTSLLGVPVATTWEVDGGRDLRGPQSKNGAALEQSTWVQRWGTLEDYTYESRTIANQAVLMGSVEQWKEWHLACNSHLLAQRVRVDPSIARLMAKSRVLFFPGDDIFVFNAKSTLFVEFYSGSLQLSVCFGEHAGVPVRKWFDFGVEHGASNKFLTKGKNAVLVSDLFAVRAAHSCGVKDFSCVDRMHVDRRGITGAFLRGVLLEDYERLKHNDRGATWQNQCSGGDHWLQCESWFEGRCMERQPSSPWV